VTLKEVKRKKNHKIESVSWKHKTKEEVKHKKFAT
jgi:hypothetical protein